MPFKHAFSVATILKHAEHAVVKYLFGILFLFGVVNNVCICFVNYNIVLIYAWVRVVNKRNDASSDLMYAAK